MPKISTSVCHTSHQDGKKRPKRRGRRYRDATKTRKLRKTRFKGIVEEVIKPLESGKPMSLNCEENQLVGVPIIPTEVYDPNPVNFNVPAARYNSDF